MTVFNACKNTTNISHSNFEQTIEFWLTKKVYRKKYTKRRDIAAPLNN